MIVSSAERLGHKRESSVVKAEICWVLRDMIIAFYLLFMLRPDFYASLDTEFSVYCLCPQIHRHVGSVECPIHHAVTFLPQPETHKKSCVDVLRVYFYDST